jgi:hypothetical protein
MPVRLPYPYPDPLTGQWDPFALIRNLSILSFNVHTTVPVNKGGTGLDTYAAGDLIYASGTATLTRLGIGAAGQFLRVNSGGNAPEWQTFNAMTTGDVLGTANEIEVSESGGDVTIGIVDRPLLAGVNLSTYAKHYEIAADPNSTALTSGGNAKDRMGVYMKNDKIVFAYNHSGTVRYVTFAMDGGTGVAWNHTSTAP